MYKNAYILTLLLLLVPLAGCLESETGNDVESNEDTEVRDLTSQYAIDYSDVKMEVTHDGETYQFTIQLNLTAAPMHTDSFQTHVSEGNYISSTFHRIISEFMIQGGDFENGDGSGGYAANWYGICESVESTIEDCPDQSSWNLPSEFDNGLLHLPCTISMARSSSPNSGGSQFFIVPSDSTPDFLDGDYTVFGKITEGCEDVTALSKVPTAGRSGSDPVSDLVIISAELLDQYSEYFNMPVVIEEIPLVCSEIGFTTHQVTTSYPDSEFETWIEANTIRDGIYIQNSDLSYFEEATQVLVNEQIFNLTPYKSPVYDTHTKINVDRIYLSDNTDESIDYNIGDVVCLIENPEIELIHDGRADSRLCKITTIRLENGNYEHHHPDCNYVLTENLDRTSTIRGSVEFPSNSVSPETCDSLPSFNSFNSSIVGVNISVAGSWGHFGGGNEFRLHYNGIESNYVKSYFINAQEQDRWSSTREAMIKSLGIHNIRGCNIAAVMLYADENLTEPASLDRNLTTADTWGVIAKECGFNRGNMLLGESQLMFSHGCSGMYLGMSPSFCENNPDICENIDNETPSEESHLFYNNLTQAIITQNYSMWHAMLADQVHSINSDVVYEKQNLTVEFFENFTNQVGIIDLENASRLDLEQGHYRMKLDTYDVNSTNWTTHLNPNFGWESGWVFESPLVDSALSQDRIYNDTGWGYGEIFTPSATYEIWYWGLGPNTTPLISEYLLTVVMDRDENGTLSIVGIADYAVEIPR